MSETTPETLRAEYRRAVLPGVLADLEEKEAER
jgi:hypothetical protein